MHGYGYGFLSCVRPNGSPRELGPPTGPTIEQHVAAHLSADAPHKSVLIGLSGQLYRRGETEELSTFAAGPGEPLAHTMSAAKLFAGLSGGSSSDREWTPIMPPSTTADA